MDRDDRLECLERRTDELSQHLRALETEVAATATMERPPPPTRIVVSMPPQRRDEPIPATIRRDESSPPSPAARRRDASSLEDLLGGRVLAWAGGAAVIVGLVLLAAVAVSHGWLGAGERTAFAGLVSVALLALGVRLHERRGRTDAARAAAAAGVAGLFVTAVLGARVYAVVPPVAGIVLAVSAGAFGIVLALRWEAHGLAGLGLLGALAAPAAVGASDGGTVVMLWIMGAAAAAVLLARGWEWLALAAYAVLTPQWIAWLLNHEPGVGVTLAALAAFGALGLVAGAGFEVRTRAATLRPAGALVLALSSAVLAAVGWFALRHAGSEALADWWLVALAAAHAVATAAGRTSRRVSTELVTLLATISAVLADVAAASLVHGPALPLVWVAGALVASAVAGGARRRAGALVSVRMADLGVGAHVALAVGHALVVEAPFGAGGVGFLDTAVLLVIAAACLAAGRVAGWSSAVRLVLDAVGLAAVAYLLARHLHGAALVVAWAGEAIALAAIASRTREPSAAWGAMAVAGLAGAHALIVEAPPAALAAGLASAGAALVALATVAAAAIALARTRAVAETVAHAFGVGPEAVAGGFWAAAVLAVLHLASTELVDAIASPPERSQMLLSALWAMTGTGALLAGLRGDRRPIRLGGLALLLVTAAKVFVFDLAALDSGWRVASFLVLGLLLLGGAFAWQRVRPQGQAVRS